MNRIDVAPLQDSNTLYESFHSYSHFALFPKVKPHHLFFIRKWTLRNDAAAKLQRGEGLAVLVDFTLLATRGRDAQHGLFRLACRRSTPLEEEAKKRRRERLLVNRQSTLGGRRFQKLSDS